jgi:hypothetical protein
MPRSFEFARDPIDDSMIEVVAAEVRVAVGRFRPTTPSPTSRIEISNVPPLKFLHRDRLVLPSCRVRIRRAAVGSLTMRITSEAGDLTGILRRLALRVVEYAGTVITALVTG